MDNSYEKLKLIIQVGDEFESTSSGKFIVTEVLLKNKYKVKFEDGFEKVAFSSNIKKGLVNNPNIPSLEGVGIIGKGKFNATFEGKFTEEYNTWQNMIKRVYNTKNQSRHPSYMGCSVSEEFLNFQDFAAWFEKQPNRGKGYHLDKDLTVLGNKVYSSETCCLVPIEINNMFLDGSKRYKEFDQRGVFYISSGKRIKRWRAYSFKEGKKVYLGYYHTKQEALNGYWEFKSRHCLSVLEKFKNELPTKVVNNILDIIESKGSILNKF